MLLGGIEQIEPSGQHFQAWAGLSLTPGRGQDGHIHEALLGIAAEVCRDVI